MFSNKKLDNYTIIEGDDMKPIYEVREKDVIVEDKKGEYMFIKEVTIIYNPHTSKGKGISQIIDGLRRIL